jgi:ATP-dependent helicase/DNAse subunit B
MLEIKDIVDGSLLIANKHDKTNILKIMNQESIFVDAKILPPFSSLEIIEPEYVFFLKRQFHIEPFLSERLKKYFPYIDFNKTYDNEKIDTLKKYKSNLIINDLCLPGKKYKNVYSVNNAFVAGHISNDFKRISLNKTSVNPISMYVTKDKYEQLEFAYNWVIRLIESGVDPSDINIVNTMVEDDLQLKKLFLDAGIPFTLFKRVNLNSFPLVIEALEFLRNDGIDVCQRFIESQPASIEKKKLTNIFNKYDNITISDNLDCFIYEINNTKVYPFKDVSGIRISDFNDFNYYENSHYLLMNYYEEVFPRKYLDNDYLSDEEADILGYPTSIMLNNLKRQEISSCLNQIDNLTISYPDKVIENVLPCEFNLARKVTKNKYEPIAQDYTYLEDLALLKYSKLLYKYKTYGDLDPEFDSYFFSFNDLTREYMPVYSGIEKETLDTLIKNNNTLSAYKLESYNLCPFQYLLSYLLKLDDFKSNIFTYVGNIIHKALEMNVKEGKYDLDAIFAMYDLNEEESYKLSLFKELIVENVAMITEVVRNFEESSEFKKILPEARIKEKLNEDFMLTGIIDKVMIDEKHNYYLVIDYKYGDKNFSLNEIDKDYKLQLPFYLYAMKLMHPELKPAGMLYQQTALLKESKDSANEYKMKGMVIDKVSVLERIDPSLSRIQGVRVKRDGSLYKYKNTIVSEETLNNIIDKTEKTVRAVAQRISDGDFSIAPILTDFDQMKKDSVSCRYCKYGSICYSKNKRIGGDEDVIY